MRDADSDDLRFAVSCSHANGSFIGGVGDTLMLDVIFITRSAVTAAVVKLCVTLPFDAARATVPPINGHDSLRSGRCGRLASPHRVVNSRGTGRCTVTCMVTLAGEVHRRSVCMTKTRNVLRWVKTLTGTPSRMRGGSRACVATRARRTLRIALTLRQHLAVGPTLLTNASGNAHTGHRFFIRRFWPSGIPCACHGLTACIYLWGRLVGELLRDREAFEGENVRDRCPNSIVVSFVNDSILTFARHFHEIGPGTGDLCRRWGGCDACFREAVLASRCHPGAQHCSSVDPKVESCGTPGRRSKLHLFPLCTVRRLNMTSVVDRRLAKNLPTDREA